MTAFLVAAVSGPRLCNLSSSWQCECQHHVIRLRIQRRVHEKCPRASVDRRLCRARKARVALPDVISLNLNRRRRLPVRGSSLDANIEILAVCLNLHVVQSHGHLLPGNLEGPGIRSEITRLPVRRIIWWIQTRRLGPIREGKSPITVVPPQWRPRRGCDLRERFSTRRNEKHRDGQDPKYLPFHRQSPSECP